MNAQRGGGQRSITVADVMISEPKLCDETTTVADLRRFFLDDHVHVALVTQAGCLTAVIERSDIDLDLLDTASAAGLGRLHGRVVNGDERLGRVRRRMLGADQRRLAVIDSRGRLIGLLCLKRSRAGFCSDHDVHARMIESGLALERVSAATGPQTLVPA